MIFVEIFGTLTGVFSVWLLTRQNSFGWPLGLIYIVLSMILFLSARLYGELIAHVVFLILSLYGWFNWSKEKGSESTNFLPSFLTTLERIYYAVSLCVMSLGVGYLFQAFTNNALPYLDSFVMSMSFAGMWLSARKKMENWILWMLVNTLSIGMYFSQLLYVYALLYCFFLLLAFNGYAKWKRSIALPYLGQNHLAKQPCVVS